VPATRRSFAVGSGGLFGAMIAGVPFNTDAAFLRESGAAGTFRVESALVCGLAIGTQPDVIATSQPKNDLTQ
jgi:hypothetical protein